MFQKKWKCKLCGSIVNENAIEKSKEMIAIKMLNDELFVKNNIHFCNESKIGILELIGIEKV